MPVMLKQTTKQTEVARIALRGETGTASRGTAGGEDEDRHLRVCVNVRAANEMPERAEASEDARAGAVASMADEEGRKERAGSALTLQGTRGVLGQD
jgi:hypothetical protein